VPNLDVDLIATPHELLGLSDEPDAGRCAGEDDRAMYRRVFRGSGVGPDRLLTLDVRLCLERGRRLSWRHQKSCAYIVGCQGIGSLRFFRSSSSLCVARLDGFPVQSRFQVNNLRIRDRLLRHDRRSERVCVIESFAKAPTLVGQHIRSRSSAVRPAIAECPFVASGTIHRLSLYNPGRSPKLLPQVHPLRPFQ